MICPQCKYNISVQNMRKHINSFCEKLAPVTKEDRQKILDTMSKDIDAGIRQFEAEQLVKDVESGKKTVEALDAKERELWEHGMNLKEGKLNV